MGFVLKIGVVGIMDIKVFIGELGLWWALSEVLQGYEVAYKEQFTRLIVSKTYVEVSCRVTYRLKVLLALQGEYLAILLYTVVFLYFGYIYIHRVKISSLYEKSKERVIYFTAERFLL